MERGDRRVLPRRVGVPAGRGPPPRLTARALTAFLVIEYDGTGFAGWAVQPGRRTVQEEVERALAAARGEPTALTVAGRTDAGVHARGQVASHAGEPAHASRLNAALPEDLRVVSSQRAPEGFDARRDASSRLYRYRLLDRRAPSPLERDRALHWPRALDRSRLARCAAALPGEHDFTAFTPTQTAHHTFARTVSRAEWTAAGNDLFELWIEADAFLRHMVRILVGTMLEVAAGLREVGSFAALLDGRPRSEAGPTAPSHGLYLEAVRYPPEALPGP